MTIFDHDIDFQSFDKASGKDWRDKIIQDLKGKDYDETLVRHTLEDIDIQPDFHPDNTKDIKQSVGLAPYLRGWKKDNFWEIRSTAKTESASILQQLQNGASAIGLENIDSAKPKKLFQDIQLDIIHLDFLTLSDDATKNLQDYFRACNYQNETLRGLIRKDLLLHDDKQQIEKALEQWQAYSRFKPLSVDAAHWAEQGATMVHQLGIALAAGKEYIEPNTDKFSIDDTAGALAFHFSTSTDIFFEIAKYRAFRVLWAHLVNQYEPQHECSKIAFVHAQTSQWNLAQKDTYTNLIRNTLAASASVMGGVDMLTVSPHDINEPTAFTRRMSRNISLILREESFLARVVDPAGGATYINYLTEQLTEKAWSFFQSIESKGGFSKGKEFIQSTVDEDKEKRKNQYKNDRVLVGINQFEPDQATGKVEQNTIAAAFEK